MAAGIPPVPANFKQLQHYIKTAAEHDARDPVVAYYCNYPRHHYAIMMIETPHQPLLYQMQALVELLILALSDFYYFLIIATEKKYVPFVKYA